MADPKPVTAGIARRALVLALFSSGLVPIGILGFLLTGSALVGVVCFVGSFAGGHLVARLVDYQPSGWQSRETGALSDPTLRQLSTMANWPPRAIVGGRWMVGALFAVTILVVAA